MLAAHAARSRRRCTNTCGHMWHACVCPPASPSCMESDVHSPPPSDAASLHRFLQPRPRMPCVAPIGPWAPHGRRCHLFRLCSRLIPIFACGPGARFLPRSHHFEQARLRPPAGRPRLHACALVEHATRSNLAPVGTCLPTHPHHLALAPDGASHTHCHAGPPFAEHAACMPRPRTVPAQVAHAFNWFFLPAEAQ